MIESITFNTAESKIVVRLEDGTEKTYTDAETYLTDHPDRVDDTYVFQPYMPEPAHVPTVLTMKQARLALLAAGYLDAVEAGIASMPKESQIIWEFASTVERTDPLTATLAAALGLDAAALDALFLAGAAL